MHFLLLLLFSFDALQMNYFKNYENFEMKKKNFSYKNFKKNCRFKKNAVQKIFLFINKAKFHKIINLKAFHLLFNQINQQIVNKTVTNNPLYKPNLISLFLFHKNDKN